jgi:hypothetical protein
MFGQVCDVLCAMLDSKLLMSAMIDSSRLEGRKKRMEERDGGV